MSTVKDNKPNIEESGGAAGTSSLVDHVNENIPEVEKKEDDEDEKEDDKKGEDVIEEDKKEDNKKEDDIEDDKKEKLEETNKTNYDPKNVHYEGDLAIYTDPKTGTQYKWDKEKNEWLHKNNVIYGFEDDTHVYTDHDGVKYFWDKVKSAWFPKLDDDFLAMYQMSYGFNTTPSEQTQTKPQPSPVVNEEIKKEETDEKSKKGEKRKATEPTWFEVEQNQNNKVYVSNLPLDTTEDEFVELMQKCGFVMKDINTNKFKIKLYKEPGTDMLKGDALCTYIKMESVDLALTLLDGCDFKGKKLKVERAKFQMKGAYDPTLKPKMKKRKEKVKLKKQQEKLFDWRPEKFIGERSKNERVVVVKNVFDPAIFDKEVSLILEIQEDLREEASKLGTCRKVLIYDRHPEGVAQINMGSPEEADEVVKLFNGRWFMKRQLKAEIWDGKTKFKIAETDSQISQRIDKWDAFLEDKDDKKDTQSVQN